jgi:nucleotide-binding universal stress UspA family protein
MSILLCYDGSPSAKHAVACAAEVIAHASPAAQDVILLYVWNEPTEAADSFSFKSEALPTERLEHLAKSRAEELVEEGCQIAAGHGLTPRAMIAPAEHSIAATIARVAGQENSSMIVVGAHQRGLPGPTLESTSTALVATASRPVLVVPVSDPASKSAESQDSSEFQRSITR